jgi:hypothetical protein
MLAPYFSAGPERMVVQNQQGGENPTALHQEIERGHARGQQGKEKFEDDSQTLLIDLIHQSVVLKNFKTIHITI